MSEPSRTFQDLSQSGMPVTRSQGQTGQCGLVGHGRGQARLDPIARPRIPSINPTASRFSMSTGSLLSGAAKRPQLDPNIEVQKIGQKRDSNGIYYAFELNPITVRLFHPGRPEGPVKCSCDVFRDTENVCAHIKWLFTALKWRLQGVPLAATELQENDISSQLPALYFLLGSYPGALEQDLNEVASYDSQVPGAAGLSSPCPSNIEARSYTISDILSTFSDSQLPERLAAEFNSRGVFGEVGDYVKKRRLDLTVYALAMSESSILKALYLTVTPEYRAGRFITKQQDIANQQFRTLRDLSNAHTGVLRNEVVDCARSLRRVAHQIASYCKQYGPQPFPLEEGQRAADMLVALIESVLRHNEDLRAGQRARARSNRYNLYSYLIGDPPANIPADQPWMGDFFVLDRLESLPKPYWEHLVEKLVYLGDTIGAMALSSEPGTKMYAVKINNMVGNF